MCIMGIAWCVEVCRSSKFSKRYCFDEFSIWYHFSHKSGTVLLSHERLGKVWRKNRVLGVMTYPPNQPHTL